MALVLAACQAPAAPPSVPPGPRRPEPVTRVPPPAAPAWTWATVERARETRDESAARCPREMTLVRGQVCVDRFEAHLVAVGEDGTERPWSPHEAPTGRVRARQIQHPAIQAPTIQSTGAGSHRSCCSTWAASG